VCNSATLCVCVCSGRAVCVSVNGLYQVTGPLSSIGPVVPPWCVPIVQALFYSIAQGLYVFKKAVWRKRKAWGKLYGWVG